MHGGEAAAGVEGAGEQGAGAGRFHQAHAAVDHSLVEAVTGAEVEHRRLGEAADDLVGRGDDDVGAAGDRVGGEVGMEAQVRPPGLVDRERNAAGVGDLGEAGDIRAGAEVGGRDDHRADRPRRLVEGPGERRRGKAVGDPEAGVELGGREGGPQPAEHQPVDHGGVDVALHDHLAAAVGERQADRVVALRGAVDQEPAAARAPGAGGEPLGPLERGRLRADVDALGDRGDVVADADLADQLAHLRVGTRPALVPGHLEPAGIAGGVGEQRVDVGGRVLALVARLLARASHPVRVYARPGAHFGEDPGAMEHTPHGYWLEEAGAVEPLAPLRGERDADLVVVGGGYTGMWTAWHAKALEPEARVVLLEAGERCGRGPSGRNGGFCNVMWLSLPNMRERWGTEGALAVARAAQAAVAGIEDFCEREGVDAWFRRGGYLKVSTAPAFDDSTEEALAACRELGEGDAAVELSAEQVAGICSSPVFRGGVLFPDAATVQPARLALGLRERLLAAGVEVFESSPMRRLRRHRDGVEARTANGAIRAESAVIAIGGAAKALGRPLQGRLSVASSHMVITEPVPELLEEIGWTGGESITDSRALVDYFRTTPDGRIAFGWGGGRIQLGARLGDRAELDREVVDRVIAHLRAIFPGLEGREIIHAWGGPIDASPTHLPFVRALPGDRAFAAAGYTGNGVGPSHMVGRTLASLALGRRDEASRLAFVERSPGRVPPEPFHWLGGEAIRRGIMAKEEAQLAGREPSWLSSRVAAVPDLIGFHIGR